MHNTREPANNSASANEGRVGMGDALLGEGVDVVEIDVEVVAGAWVVLDGRVAGVDSVAMLPGSDASRGASTEFVDLPSSAQLTPSTNAATTIAAMRVRAEQAP